jgi:hypothetical protein
MLDIAPELAFSMSSQGGLMENSFLTSRLVRAMQDPALVSVAIERVLSGSNDISRWSDALAEAALRYPLVAKLLSNARDIRNIEDYRKIDPKHSWHALEILKGSLYGAALAHATQRIKTADVGDREGLPRVGLLAEVDCNQGAAFFRLLCLVRRHRYKTFISSMLLIGLVLSLRLQEFSLPAKHWAVLLSGPVLILVLGFEFVFLIWPIFYYTGRRRSQSWFAAYRNTPLKLADLQCLVLNISRSYQRFVSAGTYRLGLNRKLIIVSRRKSSSPATQLAMIHAGLGKKRVIDGDLILCNRLPGIVQLTIVFPMLDSISVFTKSSSLFAAGFMGLGTTTSEVATSTASRSPSFD